MYAIGPNLPSRTSKAPAFVFSGIQNSINMVGKNNRNHFTGEVIRVGRIPVLGLLLPHTPQKAYDEENNLYKMTYLVWSRNPTRSRPETGGFLRRKTQSGDSGFTLVFCVEDIAAVLCSPRWLVSKNCRRKIFGQVFSRHDTTTHQ